ncbi:hypothetical protein DL96DRAFT_1604648 [Flagelloscypha sp. PMI_526]|nr:hypothetical protein DL96DRAFT_1604648 [Flagelloscypha sp. PMI_526]
MRFSAANCCSLCCVPHWTRFGCTHTLRVLNKPNTSLLARHEGHDDGAGSSAQGGNSTAAATTGGSSDITATRKQNGLDAQALNEEFKNLKADATCDASEIACIGGKLALCDGGKFITMDCPATTTCAAVPLVNKAGTSVVCTTEQDIDNRMKEAGVNASLTGASNSTTTPASSNSTASASGASSDNSNDNEDCGDDTSNDGADSLKQWIAPMITLTTNASASSSTPSTKSAPASKSSSVSAATATASAKSSAASASPSASPLNNGQATATTIKLNARQTATTIKLNARQTAPALPSVTPGVAAPVAAGGQVMTVVTTMTLVMTVPTAAVLLGASSVSIPVAAVSSVPAVASISSSSVVVATSSSAVASSSVASVATPSSSSSASVSSSSAASLAFSFGPAPTAPAAGVNLGNINTDSIASLLTATIQA